MSVVTRFIFLFPVIGFLCTNAFGDGKMFFYMDKISAGIPYQRAFLIYNEGFETLILQSKYEFSQAADVNSLGWVVPVPSVPEIASVDAEHANLFFLWTSIRTGPVLFTIRSFIVLLVIVIFLASAIIPFVLLLISPIFRIFGLANIKLDKLYDYFPKTVFISFALLVIIMIFGLFSTAGSKLGGVEVVKAEQVGVYDVKVIKGDSTEAIMDWLKENTYSFSEKDTAVFNDYVNRKWCFVTAKVRQDIETEKEKISANGLVAPLILKFESEKAIYPLTLTSAIGTETEVLLYTLSKNKLNCNERMKLRYSGSNKTKGMFDSIMTKDMEKLKAIFENLPKDMIICKFKQKLTSEQMKQDLEFENAPNNEPYRETKIVW
jgi:hypothetical protein